MDPNKTAIILIGYQNDYFSPTGVLHGFIDDDVKIAGVLDNTLDLLARLRGSAVTCIATPIVFTADYNELQQPMGILLAIKENRAFQAGSRGAETIPEFAHFGTAILEIPGKRGLNAFYHTAVEQTLVERGITHVVIAGAVTSVCIDSTARAAHDRGYQVAVLSDCTVGKSRVEQDFFCQQIMPLYATVMDRRELLKQLAIKYAPN